MSVVSINEITEQDGAAVNEKGEFNINRAFRVDTDDASQSARSVLDEAWDSTLPVHSSRHPTDDTMFVTNFNIRRVSASRLVWVVVVTYSPQRIEQAGADNLGESIHPTDLPPVIRYGTGRAVAKDISLCYRAWFSDAAEPALSTQSARNAQDVAIVNSAREEFDPGIAEDETLFVISISRNETAEDADPDDVEVFHDTLNGNAIKIGGIQIAPIEGRMREISLEQRYDTEGELYYAASYEIEVMRGGHLRRILDRGFNERVAGEPTPIKDADNKPVTEPQLLDGSGAELADGGDEVSLIVQTKFAYSWDRLRLPK